MQGSLSGGPAAPDKDSSGPTDTGAACPARILSAINKSLGTNFTLSNILGARTAGIGKAVNIDVYASDLTVGQFNSIMPGNRWSLNPGFASTVLGIGPSLHIANPSSWFDHKFSIFANQNDGGQLTAVFTAHIDSGNPNRPVGFITHLFTDLLSGHRQLCP